ncbi:hypothetical protein ACHAPQ_004242 [Fusarium lateritium]
MSTSLVRETNTLEGFISTSFPGDQGSIPFAHIKMPHTRKPNFECKVITSFPGDDGIFLLVTSNEDVGARKLSTSNLERPTFTISFFQLLKLLETSRMPIPGSQGAWDMSLSGAEAIAANILPKDATVLFFVDSSMPAECALALHGILQWALDQFEYPDGSIRILTMSSADHGRLVSDLICLRYPEFNLPELYQSTELPDFETPTCNDDEAIVADICDAIMKHAGTSQLVISFGDESFNSMLNDEMTKVRGGMVKRFDIANRMGCEVLDLVKSVPIECANLDAIFDTTFQLCLPGDFPLVPPVFENYGLICLVADGRLPHRQAWHRNTRQIIGFNRYASKQQRLQQICWLQQESPEKRFYSRNESFSDFSKGGYHHHQMVEDTHLGGFIASVYDREFWGIDIFRTLNCFIRCPARLDQTTRRLKTNGILSKGRFGLAGSEADVFRAILPLVEYDYRLALFGCLDSNPVVRGVKLEAISVLMMGVRDIIQVKDETFLETLLDDDELFQKLIGACMGPSRCLANSGLIWLVLGLWKRYSLSELTVNSSPEQADVTRWLDEHLQPLGKSVNDVKAHREGLYKAVIGAGVSARDHLHYELSEAEQFKIHTHLFHAYMFQLTLVRPGEEGYVTHFIYSAMMEVHKTRGAFNLNLLIDEPTFLESEQAEGIVGISHSMTKVGDKIFFEDWTWVPLEVIATWMVDNAPNTDLISMLLDMTLDVEENVDEY